MDEVSGMNLQTVASDLDTPYCQPCSRDGKSLPAQAFCNVCNEFMCSICTNVHRNQRVSRSHTLLDKSVMPTTISGHAAKEESKEACDIHSGEFIKYFCPAHETLNCGHCSVLNHYSCKQQIISDIAKSFKYDQGYEAIKQVIFKLQKDIDACDSDVEEKIKLVEKTVECEISKLEDYQNNVNKYFDERKAALLKTIAQMKNIDEELLDMLKSKCNTLKTQVNEVKANLEAKEDTSSQFFIEAKKAKNLLEELQFTLAEINKMRTIHQYQFIKDPDTERVLESRTGLGTIEEKVDAKALEQNTLDMTSLRFTKASDIPTKSPSDIFDCRLSSLLLLDSERLLLADLNNQAVKLLDLQTNVQVSEVRVLGRPKNMCLLPGDNVAVSLTSCSVQLLSTRGQLNLCKSIEVKGWCRGIGYHNDFLIVSYHNAKVEKMDMEGKVLKKVSSNWFYGNQFQCPWYITIVSEGQTAAIYVSDRDKNTITKLDMDLNILKTFEDPILRSPRGCTAVENQLLICGENSNNIVCLDLPSGQMTKLLGENEGIQAPINVCFSKTLNTLYVTCSQPRNDIMVYKKAISS